MKKGLDTVLEFMHVAVLVIFLGYNEADFNLEANELC